MISKKYLLFFYEDYYTINSQERQGKEKDYFLSENRKEN